MGWQHILLITAALMIVASICITSKWRDNGQEDPYSDHNKDGPRKNIPYSTNPDIAALTETIRIEGRANRKEETREDDRKTVTDVVNTLILVMTLGVLLYTCVAIISQVEEMKRVYPQIEKQGIAASKQGNAADRQFLSLGPNLRYDGLSIVPFPALRQVDGKDANITQSWKPQRSPSPSSSAAIAANARTARLLSHGSLPWLSDGAAIPPP